MNQNQEDRKEATGSAESSDEKDADDTLDEETIIRDVGQERINERMKMQSQIKS